MKRIIIVDDDPGVQDAFKLIFDPRKYEVIVYSNGLPILNDQSQIPDLYILDKQLTGVDGLEICRFLKTQQKTSHIPVIICSASPDLNKFAHSAGADDSFEKPFTLTTIRSIVDKYLNH